MSIIRVFFGYKHVEGPWGGANTFIRALSKYLSLQKERFAIIQSCDQPADIIFMNQLAPGPGNDFKRWEIGTIRRKINGSGQKNGGRAFLVVRAVNLSANVDFEAGVRTRIQGYLNDRKTINLLNIANLVIFQSDYQKNVFFDAGYRGDNFVVIHNGGTPDFYIENPVYNDDTSKLKLISTSFSTRSIKRHDIIARFSTLSNVEVGYFGNWPCNVPSLNVRLHGVKGVEEIKLAMSSHHYFLHPATRDACPNSIIEAMSAGLPVIFNPHRSSSAEIVADAGIAIDEPNLENTIERARRELNFRRSCALLRRQEFLLEKCVEKYASAFKELYVGTQG